MLALHFLFLLCVLEDLGLVVAVGFVRVAEGLLETQGFGVCLLHQASIFSMFLSEHIQFCRLISGSRGNHLLDWRQP